MHVLLSTRRCRRYGAWGCQHCGLLRSLVRISDRVYNDLRSASKEDKYTIKNKAEMMYADHPYALSKQSEELLKAIYYFPTSAKTF